MAFTSFANRLPDPAFKITEAGENANSGDAGPGFASVKFSSEQPVSVSRTKSRMLTVSTLSSFIKSRTISAEVVAVEIPA